jgi:transposase-like protein
LSLRLTKLEGLEVFVIPYSAAFRTRMVSKLTGPHAVSARTLATETGLAQATLSRWLKEASRLPRRMPDDDSKPKAAQHWTPDEKLKVVVEASGLSDGELGVFLRSKGVHAAMLDEWRRQALGGLRGTDAASKQQHESKEVRDLKRELARKDKALAETAALLVLKKKVLAIWGDEDDSTNPKKDE